MIEAIQDFPPDESVQIREIANHSRRFIHLLR